MRDAVVVVGANYGDEGKGLITDFEVRRTQAGIVARFNGGAQAGHTVTTDTARHVFGHVGAGALAGADTWLSSKFIVNPFVFDKELDAVNCIAAKPAHVVVHSDARVSTLYDMALNSLVERQRGNNRHGSCGLGINETVTRHERFPITYESMLRASYDELIHDLRNIRDQWVPQRLQDLGITDVPEPFKTLFMTDDMMAMASIMKKMLLTTKKRLTVGTPVVFEGAQGLALDEYLGFFPHVTRSITGLPYAIVAAHELGVPTLQPVYVTRAYFTRHGAGPLANEDLTIGATIDDKTNVHNEWQGTIRYAPLDLYELAARIANDQARAIYIAQTLGVHLFTPTIALTCLDQLADTIPVIDLDKSIVEVKSENLAAYIQFRLGYNISHISRGPKSSDVEYFKSGI